MPKPARKRGYLWFLALLLVAAAGAYVFRAKLFGGEQPRVMSALVQRGEVEETVLASGTLKPVKLVAVGAQVSGRVIALKVALGQTVKTGELVAQIDSVTQENALRTAQASLAAIRAQRVEKEAVLTRTEQTLTRQRAMVTQKAISQADLETAEADVKTTRAQIDALDAQIIEAEVAVETAKANLGYTRITAPIDGTVLAIVSQEGQTVNAAQSAPTIIVLGDLSTMTVRAEISEADIVRVKPGQPLYFTILGDPDRKYDAQLEFIEPAPESIRSDSSFSTSTSSLSSSSSSSSSSEAIYYNGVFNVPNEDGRLRTYMTAEVHIVLGDAKNVLTIPASALGTRDKDGGYAVRVLGDDGKISSRSVQIGLTDKIVAEVRSGLSEGERVVTGQLAGAEQSQRRPRGPMGF